MSREPIVTMLVSQAPATTRLTSQPAPVNYLQFGGAAHAPPASIISVQAARVSVVEVGQGIQGPPGPMGSVTLTEVDAHIAAAILLAVGGSSSGPGTSTGSGTGSGSGSGSGATPNYSDLAGLYQLST